MRKNKYQSDDSFGTISEEMEMKYKRKRSNLIPFLLFAIVLLISGCQTEQVQGGQCYQRTVRSMECYPGYLIVGAPQHFEGYDIEVCCPANHKSLQEEMMLRQNGRPY